MSKKIICLILTALFLISLVPSSFADGADYTIEKGESISLTGSANGYNLACHWVVDDPSIISVKEAGTSRSVISNYIYLSSTVKVTGIKAGTAKLSFVDSNGRIRASSIIEVTPTKCELEGHSLTLTKKKAATCTDAGNTEYYLCSVCGKAYSDSEGDHEISRESTVIKALGHKLSKTDAKKATCTVGGNSEYYTCSVCGKYFSDAQGKNEIAKDSWIISALGHDLSKTESKAATCTEEGNSDYYTCSKCSKYFSDEKGTKEIGKDSWVIPPLGHALSKTESKAATCTEDGNSDYYTCSTCSKFFSDEKGTEEIEKDSWIIAASGHSFGEWIVIKDASENEDGMKERICSVCGEKEQETLPKKSHEEKCPSKLFKDVEKNTTHWTHLPIDYVLSHKYMAGTGASTFEPSSTVSRAMIVQVLYAMEGKPSVGSKAGFKDVASGKWYADAINWAAKSGIVAGYTNGNFGVNDPVKRQDLVAIMYKYAVYKNYDTSTNGNISKFADYQSISSYAVPGMKWGISHNIISGIASGSKMNAQPKDSATRAQLAVILKAFDENVKK